MKKRTLKSLFSTPEGKKFLDQVIDYGDRTQEHMKELKCIHPNDLKRKCDKRRR